MKYLRSIYISAGNKVKWYHIVILYAVQIIIFQIMVNFILPVAEQDLDGWRVFDMMKQGYDQKVANDIILKMSQKSREVYLYIQMPLDFIYPVIMAAVYFLIFTKAWVRQRYMFSVLPLLLIIFDWTENIFIILIMNEFHKAHTVPAASLFTQAKAFIGDFVLYYLAIFSIVVIFIKFIREKLKQRR